jgi:hypothetical protein
VGRRYAAHTCVAQCLDKLRHEPVPISDFDGEFVVFRQFLQEWAEAGEKVIHSQERFLVEIAELE